MARGAPLIKLADINRLRADLHLPLSLASSLRPDETIELRADLPNSPLLNASIVCISSMIDAAAQTIRIVVDGLTTLRNFLQSAKKCFSILSNREILEWNERRTVLSRLS